MTKFSVSIIKILKILSEKEKTVKALAEKKKNKSLQKHGTFIGKLERIFSYYIDCSSDKILFEKKNWASYSYITSSYYGKNIYISYIFRIETYCLSPSFLY